MSLITGDESSHILHGIQYQNPRSGSRSSEQHKHDVFGISFLWQNWVYARYCILLAMQFHDPEWILKANMGAAVEKQN